MVIIRFKVSGNTSMNILNHEGKKLREKNMGLWGLYIVNRDVRKSERHLVE